MDNITIEKLIKLVEAYNKEEIERVKYAYNLAKKLHEGQKRNSGEDYIIHPLSVAYILASLHADGDTLCAGLLHDTLEDTSISKEELEKLFGTTVVNLVDGVTKMNKLNFNNKEEANLANTRKILTGCSKDVRIIIIKLADRLHNMRTLGYKSEVKQKENAKETLDIFVPLAYYIGAYYLKNELEDLSLMYLEKEIYQKIKTVRTKEIDKNHLSLEDMVKDIRKELEQNNINSSIKIYTKNIYGIYKRMLQGNDLNDIHDLFSIKILVDDIKDCYIVLGCIHKLYHSYDKYFKDYLFNPKENDYRSIHTTIFDKNDRLVQIQIRTREMEKTNTYGLIYNWDKCRGQGKDVMQEKISNQFLFSRAIAEMDENLDDQEFLDNVCNEVFGDKIIVYTKDGTGLSLPKNATPIDFAYALSEEIGNSMVGAIVNHKIVTPDYKLQNFDYIKIITGCPLQEDREKLLEHATTTHAKLSLRKILQHRN